MSINGSHCSVRRYSRSSAVSAFGGSVALQRLDQLAPRAALALQLAHAAECTGVARVDAQCLLHRVDRVLEVRQVLGVPAADLHPEVRCRAAVFALELV